jgi:hypothetical protein
MVGKENQMPCYATVGCGSQDHKEQIPGGLSQQTMTGPTKGLRLGPSAPKEKNQTRIMNITLV